MATLLDHVIPWGRSLDEYRQMFNLSDVDLKLNILGCGDGPASFNAEMTEQGNNVTSIDPIYVYSAEQIDGRIQEARKSVESHMELAKDNYVWDFFGDIDGLVNYRLATMRKFIADFEQGKREKRYLPELLPKLSFEDKQFDLALCSHFLFLYSDQLSYEFHREAILELCRVAKEVRIFPLVTLANVRSPYLTPITEMLSQRGSNVELIKTPLLFQKNADEMMRIR